MLACWNSSLRNSRVLTKVGNQIQDPSKSSHFLSCQAAEAENIRHSGNGMSSSECQI